MVYHERKGMVAEAWLKAMRTHVQYDLLYFRNLGSRESLVRK